MRIFLLAVLLHGAGSQATIVSDADLPSAPRNGPADGRDRRRAAFVAPFG
jgi:hypothetical protein